MSLYDQPSLQYSVEQGSVFHDDPFNRKDVSALTHHSDGTSTLPDFDAFTSTMKPAVQPYKTPFDSPSPEPIPLTSNSTDAAAALSFDIGEPLERPKSQRTKSANDHIAFDANSIFHHTNTSKTPTTQSTQQSQKKEDKPRSQSTRAGSSTDTQKFPSVKSQTKELDTTSTVFEGIIPEIVSSRAQLDRRASEPVELLGSRRAAEAARLAREAKAKENAATFVYPSAAAAAPSSNPTSVPSASEPAGVQRRISIRTDTLKTAEASNINLDKMGIASPVTPRKQCETCDGFQFAAGLCALCLTQKAKGDGRTSPTGVIRRVCQLWSRKVSFCHESNNSDFQARILQIKWEFWKKGEHYSVMLWENEDTGERTVFVNEKINHRSHPPSGQWKLSMVLGRTKSSAFEVLIEATSRSKIGGADSSHLYPGKYEFEIWLVNNSLSACSCTLLSVVFRFQNCFLICF
jgi:hypothetical protein